MFNHNIFNVTLGPAIYISNSTHLGAILGNMFFSLIATALGEGWAIDIATTNGLIMGNKAAAAGNDAGNNPYKDRSSDSVATMKNGWADNFDGPALSAGPGTS